MSALVDLSAKYRPKTLGEVFGHDSVVSYFKSVCRRPELSPRYYLLSAPFGTGKTTLTRAFARSLLRDDFKSGYNYIELDSSSQDLICDFDTVRHLITADVRGWKVVVLDECHLLPADTSQKLLKVLEDHVGRVFVFMATTDPQLVPPALISRTHYFQLSLFSPEKCRDYARLVLDGEGVAYDASLLDLIALNAQGHLRTVVKHCELVLLQGVDFYRGGFSSLWQCMDEFVFAPSPDDRVAAVDRLMSHPPAVVRDCFTFYFRQNVLNPASSRSVSYYNRSLVSKLFVKYLRLVGSVSAPVDYFGVLYVLCPVMDACRLSV